MVLTKEFRQKFFTNRDDSGRYMVISARTGKKYCVEPIGSSRPADWGSYNPSTGNVENKKGHARHRGSIDEADSLITKENGFENIQYSGIGTSPMSVIERMDAKINS